MDGKDGLILWTLGGAGILLLYAAYSNKSPRTVLAATLGTAPAAPTTVAAGGGTGNFSGGQSGTFDPGTGNFSSGQAGTFDASGTAYLFDADGNIAGVVPAPYQNSAATYIAPRGLISA